MSNKIIQSLWIGDRLSTLEVLCIRSFLANGHEFHLYSYSKEVKEMPPGTVLKDANEIVPAEKVYKDVAGVYTSFANWFRYKLLYAKGGWWVDMDVVCLKHFDFPEEYCFTTEIINDSYGRKIIANNAVMKSPPQAEYLHEMLERMENEDLVNAPWGIFGSRFLDATLEGYNSENFIQPNYVFCLINWHEVELFFKDELEMTFDHCHAIHLWNNIWAKKGIKKDEQYSPTSLIEQLKAKYLPVNFATNALQPS